MTRTSVDDEDLAKVGLRWKSGPWTLQGQYEAIDDALASASGQAVGGEDRSREEQFRREVAGRNVINVYWTTSKEMRYRVFD